MKVRIFEVVQYEINPKTGEPLNFGEEQIKDALNHRTIKEWAYICHDRDPFTQHDFDEYVKREGDEPSWHPGEPKLRHWHIVGRCSPALDTDVIARWFSVPVQQVEVPRGRDAFLDKVEYLTHERTEQQTLGKALYEDSEVTSNFDFRKFLNERKEKRLKYGRDLDIKDQLRYDVLYNGKTLRQVRDEFPVEYMQDITYLKKLRLEYISVQNPPKTRINYYICGQGGVGKGLICRALAKSFYPDKEYDEDIYFEVGAKNAAFEGYDGQPVIIWNDRRAIDLLQELNGRGNVFNVFDTHPTRQKQNIKYGSINLCNEVNIVNSVQDYMEFLDGLAGEYKDRDGNLQSVEDKGQSYRRFPFIIPLHEKDFDMFINKGFYDNTSDFQAYYEYNQIRGNMQRIATACGSNEKLRRELEEQTIKPITDKHNEVIEKFNKIDESEEDKIRAMFADNGTIGEVTTSDSFKKVSVDKIPFD